MYITYMCLLGVFFTRINIHVHVYMYTVHVHSVYVVYYDTGRGQHMGKSEKNSRFLPFKVHLIIFEL